MRELKSQIGVKNTIKENGANFNSTHSNRPAVPVNAEVCLLAASNGALSSPESRYPPRQLDGATRTCWYASPGTAATSRHSDDGHDVAEPHLQLDPTASTSTSIPTLPRQQSHQPRSSRDDDDIFCPSCGRRRREEISWMIEDLDAIEPAPLESQRTPTRLCTCDQAEVSRRGRGDLRKVRSTEVRSEVRWASQVTWGTTSFLSPNDAVWDLRRRTSEGTEFRWELHTSSTDLDLAKKRKCSCHSLTPDKKLEATMPRCDLRKHHSAEVDKWSVENLLTPTMHDLRKHNSDDTRFAREARWLQVPDVMPNPKPRCTCPKVKTPPPASPYVEHEKAAEEPAEKPTQREEKKLQYSKSLTPDESSVPWEKPEMKRQVSEDPRAVRGSPRKPLREKSRDRPKLERSAQVRSESSRKWGFKEKEKEKVLSPAESKKSALRARWAMKPHVSLPAEKKAPKWYRSQDETKSKSLRERPKYSIRRSMSPEPDPRQMSKLENRIVRRLISPEISITSTKWAPYEDSSPLPTIGMRKREQKHISDIKWTPYDESPSDIPIEVIDDKKWSPFHNVTPTHCPPPAPEPATPTSKSDDEDFRWRILNQVAPFPLYQGGWKDESPERTPPKKISTPEDLSPPIWTPMPPPGQMPSPSDKRKSIAQPDYSPEPSPTTARRLSKPRLTRKGAIRLKSPVQDTSDPLEDRLPQAPAPAQPLPQVIVRAASEEGPKRPKPQLMRSKALLEVPRQTIAATKRSLSEEGPRIRHRERPKPPTRTRSEEVSNYDDPWLRSDSPEMREYVTTV